MKLNVILMHLNAKLSHSFERCLTVLYVWVIGALNTRLSTNITANAITMCNFPFIFSLYTLYSSVILPL